MKTINKKGAITDELTGLAYGIVSLAIIVGVGSVVLTKFGDNVGGQANETVNYLNQQLGQSGLSGWVPAVIALTVGLVFLYLFLRRRA